MLKAANSKSLNDYSNHKIQFNEVNWIGFWGFLLINKQYHVNQITGIGKKTYMTHLLGKTPCICEKGLHFVCILTVHIS